MPPKALQGLFKKENGDQLKIVKHKVPEVDVRVSTSTDKKMKVKKGEGKTKLEKQNEAQQFSETSDVENIKAIAKLFKVNVNIDTLKEVLEEMRLQIDSNTTSIHSLNKEVSLKTSEQNLGRYLERMAQGVHNDVGDPYHSFKLNDPSFLQA